jgi:hypothetical protein
VTETVTATMARCGCAEDSWLARFPEPAVYERITTITTTDAAAVAPLHTSAIKSPSEHARAM